MSATTVKSDLAVRTIAGIAMIAVAVGAIYLGGWPLRILVGIAAGLMLVEWCDMHGMRRFWPLAGLALIAANLWLIPGLAYTDPAMPFSWYGFAAAGVFALLLGILSRRASLAGGYLYVAIPALALLFIAGVSAQLLLWVMVVTWSTDIFAYFAGRAIGGAKLAPAISPNKTWAGLIGGMAGAGVLGWLVASLFDLGAPYVWIGAPMGLLAQLGDLYESWLKRRAGVKDSSSLLPGHGGVLDRLDGLLPVAVATFLIVLGGAWDG